MSYVLAKVAIFPLGVVLLVVGMRHVKAHGWRRNGMTAIAGVVLVVVGALALFDLVRSP